MSHPVNINPVRGLLFNQRYSRDLAAVIYEGRTFSYDEFAANARELAASLAASGVGEGDRVVYLGLNSEMFLRTMFATWWLGGVFEPPNFRLAPREVGELLVRSAPRVMIVEPGHVPVVDAALGTQDSAGQENAGWPFQTETVLIDDDPAAPLNAGLEVAEHWIPLSGFVQRAEGTELGEPVETTDDTLAILMFTSGTTGKPKGVRLSHGNIFWNAFNVDSLVDTRRRDINYAVAPLFHIGALNSFTVRALVRGNTTVVRRGFVPSQVLADIENYGVNNAFFVPAMLLALTHDPEFEGSTLDSLRALICAGAPVPPVVISLFESKHVPVQQAWGLTETAPFATYLPTELTYKKAGSAGMPMLYTEVRIVDPGTGEPVTEPDTRGELWVRGPNVTTGYWEDEGATAAAFTDGWFHTGDIGYRDPDGYYYIVDRLKDMIITGGENVYPAEIERVLAEHPDISDAAVVGAPDEEWGERIVAVLQPQPGHEVPSIAELRQFCSDRLARYKLPKDLVTVAEVPRNGSGKLDKVAIRQLVRG